MTKSPTSPEEIILNIALSSIAVIFAALVAALIVSHLAKRMGIKNE